MRTGRVLSLSAAAALAACTAAPERVVSSMNYAQEPVDPSCAVGAVLDTQGFGIEGPLRREGGARAFTARFNDDLPVSVIVRQTDKGAEISAFARLDADATPLDRRKAAFAVAAADEAIYRACTTDGRTSSGDVVIEATKPLTPSDNQD